MGSEIDACDYVGNWYHAKVVAQQGDTLTVNFANWPSKWDEVFDRWSACLAPRASMATGGRQGSAIVEPGSSSSHERKKNEGVMGSSHCMDIVFVFDTTGSMAAALHKVRENIRQTSERLLQRLPNLQIAIVAVADYSDVYTEKHIDFTNDCAALTRFLESVEDTDGADEPEAYELGLRVVADLKWRGVARRAFVFFGDAYPHPPSFTTENIYWRDELARLADRDIRCYAINCGKSWSGKLFFQEVAGQTGGVYLTVDSFDNVNHLALAICFREAGPSALEAFEEKMRSAHVKSDGRSDATSMGSSLDQLFRDLQASNKAKLQPHATLNHYHMDWWNRARDKDFAPFFKLEEGHFRRVVTHNPTLPNEELFHERRSFDLMLDLPDFGWGIGLYIWGGTTEGKNQPNPRTSAAADLKYPYFKQQAGRYALWYLESSRFWHLGVNVGTTLCFAYGKIPDDVTNPLDGLLSDRCEWRKSESTTNQGQKSYVFNLIPKPASGLFVYRVPHTLRIKFIQKPGLGLLARFRVYCMKKAEGYYVYHKMSHHEPMYYHDQSYLAPALKRNGGRWTFVWLQPSTITLFGTVLFVFCFMWCCAFVAGWPGIGVGLLPFLLYALYPASLRSENCQLSALIASGKPQQVQWFFGNYFAPLEVEIEAVEEPPAYPRSWFLNWHRKALTVPAEAPKASSFGMIEEKKTRVFESRKARRQRQREEEENALLARESRSPRWTRVLAGLLLLLSMLTAVYFYSAEHPFGG